MQRLMDWLTDAPAFDPLVFVVLVALAVLLTLASIIWLVLAREEPSADGAAADDAPGSAGAALARITARSEQEAARVRRELDVDAGRGSDVHAGVRR